MLTGNCDLNSNTTVPPMGQLGKSTCQRNQFKTFNKIQNSEMEEHVRHN